MRIDKNNYEAFFLDYWENRLDAAQREQLLNFVEENPQLRAEFDAFAGTVFEPDPAVHYPDKPKLKSGMIEAAGDISPENYRYYLAASSEGDLDGDREKNLEEFLRRNPLLRDELRLYKLARISPDTGIRFEHKERLYKKPIFDFTVPGIYRIAAVAAMLILLLGLHQFLLRPGMPPASHTGRKAPSLAMKPLAARLETAGFKPGLASRSLQTPDPILGISERQAEILQPLPVLALRTPLVTDDAGPDLMAFHMPAPAVQLSAEEKTLAGRIIGGLFRKVSDRVEPTLATTAEQRKRKMTFWDLAESGINSYNHLTNNDVLLVRTLDEDGRTRKVRLINSEH